MTTHRLKTDRAYFITTILGQKPFELRFDDRNFQVGDTLILEETEHSAAGMAAGAPLAFTGRRVEAEVVSKLKGRTGLEPGWCVLGMRFVRVCIEEPARKGKNNRRNNYGCKGQKEEAAA